MMVPIVITAIVTLLIAVPVTALIASAQCKKGIEQQNSTQIFCVLIFCENFTVYGRFLCLLYKINGAYAEICMRNMNVHIF